MRRMWQLHGATRFRLSALMNFTMQNLATRWLIRNEAVQRMFWGSSEALKTPHSAAYQNESFIQLNPSFNFMRNIRIHVPRGPRSSTTEITNQLDTRRRLSSDLCPVSSLKLHVQLYFEYHEPWSTHFRLKSQASLNFAASTSSIIAASRACVFQFRYR